jgi:hypothetical protein
VPGSWTPVVAGLIGGHDLGGHLRDLDVAALGFGA